MKNFLQLQNKHIAILGCGREGKSSLNFLLKIGVPPQNITILDGAKKIEGLESILEKLEKISPAASINIILGEKYLESLKKFDIIIKTPGISLYDPQIYPYKKKIISQAQLFFDAYQGKIIAVSGTKGKSTTSTLIYETLRNAGKKVQLIGNIGNPVLDYLNIDHPESQSDEYVVFEISSYMLDGLKKTNYISVLLNIYADHLDWHNGFENYKQAKFNILEGSEYNLLRDEILAKYDIDAQDIKNFAIQSFGKTGEYFYKEGKFYIGKKEICTDQDVILEGEHNRMNICAVLGICNIMKIDFSVLQNTLKTFKGLPHRMEKVGIYGGIQWIDDAISTTPESTIQAIKTFDGRIDTIFLGGTDRGYVFTDLAKSIHKHGIKNVVLFPDSGKRIHDELKKIDLGEIKFFHTEDMGEAVKFAYKYTKMGKICLLSTASPSYTLRKNFEEKGNIFQEWIKKLSSS